MSPPSMRSRCASICSEMSSPTGSNGSGTAAPGTEMDDEKSRVFLSTSIASSYPVTIRMSRLSSWQTGPLARISSKYP